VVADPSRDTHERYAAFLRGMHVTRHAGFAQLLDVLDG
jgi:hypothetical protein